MNNLTKISFAKAQSILKKFRYKPRKDWNSEDRSIFKVCNFAVLSKKRLSNVLRSIQSLSKLGDKSHYKYSELDIKLIKELILDNLEICFEKFKQKISVMKESDIEKVKDHLKKLNDENVRLENEIKRLNFIVENFIREKGILEISEVDEILKKKVTQKKSRLKKRKTSNETLIFDEKNIKEFISQWNEGYTTSEITEKYKKIGVDIKNTRKKGSYKL